MKGRLSEYRGYKKLYLRLPRLRSISSGIFLLLCFNRVAQAGDAVEFNTDVLDVQDRSHIDLQQFSRKGWLLPGDYPFTVQVNKSELPEQRTITFLPPDDDPQGSEPCITPEIVSLLGLKDGAEHQLSWWNNKQCLDMRSLPGMTFRSDMGVSKLYLSIPLKYMAYSSDNWEPPARWSNGVAGILFDYNLNLMGVHEESSSNQQNVSGSGTAGLNAGPWRMRADWQAQYNRLSGQSTRTQQRWNWSRYYAYRAITALRAKLSLGENYLDSGMFDSFRFTGASLSSDDRQLPPNLRGYAPEVVGVAKTNAKVTVSQQGRVLYETMVAAGPFRIQDLNNAVSGKLDVAIHEQDGSVHTFQLDTASIPYLTRPGMVRYKVSAGKPSDYGHHLQGPEFATGEFSWGVNNGWSLYGGGIFAGEYNAMALGVGRDLSYLGALSLDVTQSRATRLPNNVTKQGGSYRLSYSKRFNDYDTQVTFAGYRFSDRDFMTMSQYLSAINQGTHNRDSSKELYTITLNKQFRSLNLGAYLNYSHQTYWNKDGSDTWNASLSSYFDIGRIKNLSLSLSAYRTQTNDRNDDGMYLTLSIPWGNTGTLSYDGQVSDGESSHSLRYNDQIDSNNSYSLSAGSTTEGRGTGSGYFTHDGDIAEMSASASFRGSNYSAVGLSVQGGLTATGHGAALHRTSTAGGTRMMVDTGGVSGVPVRGYSGLTHSNVFGKAVVTDISSYYRSSVQVDLDSLPDDMDATRSVVQETLTEGAIGYRKFGILAGRKGMVVITLADGSSPPFGATVVNQDHTQTGIVGDAGSTWLSGLQPDGEMQVSWGENASCHIRLPNPLPADLTQTLLLPCKR